MVKRFIKGIVSKKAELLFRKILETSNFHVRRPKTTSNMTLRYRIVRLTTTPLSTRKPFLTTCARAWGTRILLGGVVTSLELEPDEKLSEDICPSNCFDCIDVCPAKAIKGTGKVDHNLCIRYSSSNPLLTLVLGNQETRKNYSFDTLLNTIAVDDHGIYSCFECLRACPLNSR